MIDIILLSKDRACQLDLLLRSIEKFAPNIFGTMYVVYKASNSRFEEAYNLLMYKKFNNVPNMLWIRENNFYNDFVRIINMARSQFVCGLTDDCVFYRPLECSGEEIEATFNDNTFCFTLRMGLNTTLQNYLTGEFQPHLKMYRSDDKFIWWDWKSKPPFINYGYPISLDGHIFRQPQLLKLTKSLAISSLREWEGKLASNIRGFPFVEHEMAAFKQSVLYCVPCNCVQEPPMVAGVRKYYSAKELNQRFLGGQRIDLSSIIDTNVNWCHQEVEFKFNEN